MSYYCCSVTIFGLAEHVAHPQVRDIFPPDGVCINLRLFLRSINKKGNESNLAELRIHRCVCVCVYVGGFIFAVIRLKLNLWLTSQRQADFQSF